MEVGDYVRFKDKRGNTYIRKVIDGYKAHWYGCKVDKEANNVPYVSAKNIIKSSPNIIDLIEYGDIVKYKIDDEEFISEVWGEKNDYFVQNFDVPIDLKDLNIVSIVTKEQFENCMYKIGE